MDTVSFTINEKPYAISIKGAPSFKYGKHEYLSDSVNDIAFYQDWYQSGYKAAPFMSVEEFRMLKEGLTDCIQYLISTQLGIEARTLS